jgi:hypothetical protein
MKPLTTQSEPAISDEVLRGAIAEALASRGQVLHAADAVERRPYEYYSSFQLEEVTIGRDNGRRLKLILKNLSPDLMLESAQAFRPSDSSVAEREIGFYRDVLSAVSLETAEYFGSDCDVERNTYWLLLERVRGNNLAVEGDFDVWIAAAKWLARAHHQLPQAVRIRRRDVSLSRYGADCFRDWIERFQGGLPRLRFDDGTLSVEEMSFLINQARRAADLVDQLPATIIHGEFYASNILVERRDDRLRICPIDWETVGVGPGLLDLAALVAGSWSDGARATLAEAYCSACEELGEGTIDRNDAMTALRCCRLLMALRWSGYPAEWQPPPEHRCNWLAEALWLARSFRPPDVS